MTSTVATGRPASGSRPSVARSPEPSIAPSYPADLNQHDLRHRRVTTWLAEGKPAHSVQKAMGHSDLRTTRHYEHLVDEDLLQLVSEPGSERRTGS